MVVVTRSLKYSGSAYPSYLQYCARLHRGNRYVGLDKKLH
uniref:Uncharacterized protein n=1 Tax=Manihot esculenta TaxID=3983 RepID=A0A2C9V3Y7_MANES